MVDREASAFATTAGVFLAGGREDWEDPAAEAVPRERLSKDGLA